jgi:hypothetical protein
MKLSLIALSATTTAVIGSTAAFEQELEERDRHNEYTVLIWEREAQSHYMMRAWEGKLLMTPFDQTPSSRVTSQSLAQSQLVRGHPCLHEGSRCSRPVGD